MKVSVKWQNMEHGTWRPWNVGHIYVGLFLYLRGSCSLVCVCGGRGGGTRLCVLYLRTWPSHSPNSCVASRFCIGLKDDPPHLLKDTP